MATHGNEAPDEQQMVEHVALFLGPIRIQQDFLTLIVISRDDKSDSQSNSRSWSCLIEGAISIMSSA